MKIKPQEASLALFSLFCVKFLALSGSWPEVAVIGVLGTLNAFYFLRENTFREEALLKRLDVQDAEIKDIKTHVSTLKLTQTFKQTHVGNR